MEAGTDGSTLMEVIAGFRKRGFDSDFSALEGARIRCGSCESEIDAAEFVIQCLRRLEGASDPDDMLAIIATRCPSCAADGTLILGYGPMASGDDADVAVSMRDGRPQTTQGDDPSVSQSVTPGN